MKIIKIAGIKIKGILVVDLITKQKRVVILPGQNLGKKCDKLVNALNPGEGEVEHNSDYNKQKNIQEQDTNIQETPQYEVL
jgi:ribosomal protein L27